MNLGGQAPDFSLKGSDGRLHSLSSGKGAKATIAKMRHKLIQETSKGLSINSDNFNFCHNSPKNAIVAPVLGRL